MKTKSLRTLTVWIASAMILCTSPLRAQTGPSIITQPASQTNLIGATVSFN